MWKLAIILSIALAVSAYPADYKYDDAEELEHEFQGDMIISQQELDAFNGLITENTRWPSNIVPYTINPSHFTAQQISYIHYAVSLVNDLHCLTMVNRTTQADYIEFNGDSTGCSSSVGRRGGRQLIRLAPNNPEVGCFRRITIVHEIFHALGFHHMQSSYDRDEYVDIIWDNIQAGTENNFARYGTDRLTHFAVPYDYGSMMHYGAYGFSINGQATIVARQNLAGLVMGQRTEISEKDILRVKRMYGCSPVPH